jgi:hypothetical protein
MKLSKEDHEGLIAAYLMIYGLWCLSMGFLSGVIAILMGGLPALFSEKFIEIWVEMDLALPAFLLMIGAVAMAVCWLISRPFGEAAKLRQEVGLDKPSS